MNIQMNKRIIEISNPEKILFPRSKITKIQLVQYYKNIAPLMIPFLKNRFLAVERFPDGIHKQGFFQKNTPEYVPSWIQRKIFHSVNYTLCNHEEDIVYLANLACIHFHTWNSLADKPHIPDKIIFDIDPALDTQKDEMKKLVQAFKKLLLHIGLTPYVLSTGSRGLHIVIPILREHDFSYVRKFAADVAQTIIALKPDAYTMEQSIKKRKGRIFVDINRNALGQLAIAPFSVRAREGAPIAMPLSWNELKNFNPQKYTLKNFRKKNPWKRFDKKCSVKKAYQKLQEFF